MMDFLREWWAFFAFVGTGLVGWMMGVERNRWKIDDVGRSMARLEDRVRALEAQGSDEKAMLARIEATLSTVITTLTRLENRLDNKVDK